MRTRVLTLRDRAEWDGYLSRLPGADIYHTAAYHAAHQANGDGTAMAFVAEDGGFLLFHPFLQRTIWDYGEMLGKWMDIETVYGYSGPLFTDGPGAFFFLARAWQEWETLCRDTHQVAEFVRFNPMSDNVTVWLAHPIRLDRETVVIDLSGDLMAGYSQTARNKLRKAERQAFYGDILAPGASLRPFWVLYGETMARNDATDYYSFSPEYFETLQRGLGDRAQLFTVRDHGKAVAASLFLLHGDRMHYHLTGSDAEYRDSGAGNLLIHTAALWGQAHGYRWLHLGGGRTNAPDDPLLRFKASMSRERRPFYVGKRIHNPEAYRQLCDEWKRQHPGQDGGGYFLLWRKP